MPLTRRWSHPPGSCQNLVSTGWIRTTTKSSAKMNLPPSFDRSCHDAEFSERKLANGGTGREPSSSHHNLGNSNLPPQRSTKKLRSGEQCRSENNTHADKIVLRRTTTSSSRSLSSSSLALVLLEH